MNYNTCVGRRHIIRSGDTLYKISRMYGVPLALILRANPYVDVYNLQVGDTICIPGAVGQIPIGIITYLVKEQDTLNDILDRFQIDLDDLLEYNKNGSIMIKPGTTLQIPANGRNDE